MVKLLARVAVLAFLACIGLLVLALLTPSRPTPSTAQTSIRGTDTPQQTTAPRVTQENSPGPGSGVDPAILLTQAFFTDQQTQAASGQSVQDAAAPVQSYSSTVTIYAQGSVNVRACASRNCEIVGPLMNGESAQATSTVDGEVVKPGNSTWYQIRFLGRDGYVYSEYMSTSQPTSAPPSQIPAPPLAISTRPSVPLTYVCDGIDDLNCDDFPRDGYDAQQHLLACGDDEDHLDGDKDGLACEYTGR